MIRWPTERSLSMPISEPVAAIGKAKFAARVLYVGERIDLRSFAKSSRVIAQTAGDDADRRRRHCCTVSLWCVRVL